MACPRTDPVGTALVALGAAKRIGFGIQHGVQRHLNRTPDQFTEVVLNTCIIDLNDFTQRLSLAIVVHGGGFICCCYIQLRNSILATWEITASSNVER